MMPSTPMSRSTRIAAGSSTVHTTTRMPSSWARRITRSECTGSRPSRIGTCANAPPASTSVRSPGGRTPPREQAMSVVSERQPSAVVTPGASSRRRSSQRDHAPATRTRSAQPGLARSSRAIAPIDASSLRSIANLASGKDAIASTSVGIRSVPPTRRRRRSARSRSATRPGWPVTRRSAGSWKHTTCPSRVVRTSVSRWVRPSAVARPKAASVFSGASPMPPRWAMASGPVWSP